MQNTEKELEEIHTYLLDQIFREKYGHLPKTEIDFFIRDRMKEAEIGSCIPTSVAQTRDVSIDGVLLSIEDDGPSKAIDSRIWESLPEEARDVLIEDGFYPWETADSFMDNLHIE